MPFIGIRVPQGAQGALMFDKSKIDNFSTP